MKGGLNLFGRGRDIREGSSFFLLIFILSALIIGSITISGCNCSEDVVDVTEIDGGRRDVVGIGDAISDVEELIDAVVEDATEDISNLDGGSEDIPQIVDGGIEDIVAEDTTGDIGLDGGIEDIVDTGDGGAVWDYFPKTYGGGGYDFASSIQQTTDDGYIVAGYAGSFSAGDRNFWVLKLRDNGDIEWQRSYGGSKEDVPCSVQQTTDGGYIVAGETKSFGAGDHNFWVLKLKNNGDIEWQKSYGGSRDDRASSIQQTTDGGYIVAGWTDSFGAGDHNFWVLKLNSSGQVEWQRSYGERGVDHASSIQQTTDGGYIVAGAIYAFGAGVYDFWVLKLKNNGDIEWQRGYGGKWDDRAFSIQQTTDGGYIVAGETNSFGAGDFDFWVLKLRNNGDIEWQRSYGERGVDQAYSIQQTTDDGYIVAGYTTSFGAIGDFWVLKLKSNGDIEWQKSYGGDDHEYAYSIQQTTDDRYIVAGYTSSFGAGGTDFWVLKLNSDGSVDGSCPPGIGAVTDATINTTSATITDTTASANPTSGAANDTSATVQNTNATTNMQCTMP